MSCFGPIDMYIVKTGFAPILDFRRIRNLDSDAFVRFREALSIE